MERHQTRAQHTIATVEAAYALEGSEQDWLERVLASAHRDLDLGWGTYAFTCRVEPEGLGPAGSYAERGLDPRFSSLVAALNADLPPDTFGTLARTLLACDGHAGFFGPEHPSTLRFEQVAGPAGFADAFSLFVQDGEGFALDLSAPAHDPVRMHPRVRGIWRRVGMHLAAGWRLRRRIGTQRATRDALLDTDGRVQDLQAGLRDDPDVRAILTGAVRDLERARGAERDAPERALELWRGLVAGRWSLIDHWESGGRRYLAAFRNRPETLDPRALSPLERIVVRYVSLGASNKEIAFALGLPLDSIASAVAKILRKLRCRRRGELVALGEPSRWSAVCLEVSGGDLGVVAAEQTTTGAVDNVLTAAEREVAAAVARGESNQAIARARASSVHTVANQLRSIYAKLGVASRGELARRLGAG